MNITDLTSREIFDRLAPVLGKNEMLQVRAFFQKTDLVLFAKQHQPSDTFSNDCIWALSLLDISNSAAKESE
jgi:hypothetical protein